MVRRVVNYIERVPTKIRIHKEKLPLDKGKADWTFPKEERSTFPYWFAHWCSFQVFALKLGVWRPRHLLHDIEKPWLRLFFPYKKVQKWHRQWSRHHIEYKDHSKIRWIDVMIDYECSYLTKANGALDARETMELYKETDPENYWWIRYNLKPLLDKYGL